MSGLTPSQAMRKPPDKKKPPDNNNNNNNNKSGDNNNNNNNKARNNRNRRRRNGKKSVPNNKAETAAEDSKNTSDVSGTPETESTNGNNIQNNNNNNNNNKNGRKQRQRQGQRQRGNQVNENDNDNNDNNNNNNKNTTTNKNNKQPSKQRKPKKKRKKYPWRKHIPEGTVDPITLENLVSLEYPPFALCADEPYVPVSVWPVPLEQSNSNNNSNDKKTNEATASDENLEDLHRQRLADQWGEYLLPDKKENTTNKDKDKPNPTPLSKKPLNLFDGRALAFYMVSQLQFIDPFTRRDLTRAELQNLDLYLDKHGNKSSKKLKVTDAYDAKGITLSSAGAAASTAQGRTDIMQQMAQQLLNSLFVGQPSVSEQPVSLQEQYAATQRREQQQQQQRLAEQQAGGGFLQASSSSEQHGFMIIDDDENPELRGRNEFPSLAAAAAAAVPPTMYSSSHIAEQYRNRRPVTTNEVAAFPALPKTEQASSTEATTTAAASASAPTKPKKSKTLSKISGIVKKTTAHEKQKQWEAREAARRKAMLSNLTYGMNPVAMDPSQSVPAPLTATAASAASEELLQRNKAFADALGVKPASTRHYASGWARPTEINELEVALYPDALIVSAKEHTMDVLVKLERRWKRFLDDDKVASLPLNKMNRGLRKLVHHYAEFWHLKTESFDPEPNRYIHCVKLPETRMPQPLLSEVARNWRGPSLPDATRTIASVMHDHTSQQTAGQTTAPPVLRSATAMSSSKGDLVAFAAQMNSRSEVLMDKQRPQLKLLPRSVPLELPPPAEDAQANLEEDLRRKQVRLEEKQRKEREIEQKKKQALEDAFCSDDDESVQEKAAGFSDSDSEWGDDQEAVFDGSDEE